MNKERTVVDSETVDSFIRCIQALNFAEMKKFLKKYGPEIANRLDSRTRLPSIFFAINISDQRIALDFLKELIKSGASLSFRDERGNTFLHYACSLDKPMLVAQLIKKKMDVNSVNIFNQSVLFILAKRNCIEAMRHVTKVDQESKVLHDLVNVNSQDVFGRTPIFYAAEQGNREICEKLIKMGAKIDIVDYEGHCALYYAKKSLKADVVRLMTPPKPANEDDDEEEVMFQFNLIRLDDNLKTKLLTVEEIEDMLEKFPDLAPLLMNPQTINTSDVLVEDWQKKAIKMVKTCLKNKNSEYFKEPVNEKTFGIDDYYKVIKKPMDFGSILTKLTYNGYRNKEEFVSDVQLIFENCFYYNGHEHYVSICAKEIKSLFESICDFE